MAGFAVGCGEKKTGYRLSGKVTFKGQNVPAGKVYILPDNAKGNSGASGFADIKNGVYDTDLEGGNGAPPGAVILAVEGIDPNPPAGAEPDVTSTALFPRYEKKVDLPASDSVQDIEVPEDAANAAPQPQETPSFVSP